MSYTTYLDKQNKCIEVIHEGDVDLGETIRARAEVVREAKINALSCALIDLKGCRFCLSTPDLYQFGNSFDKAGIPQNFLIGGILGESDDKIRFLETVAQNRFMSLKFFNTREEAKDWLGLSH